ncbi:uncharacterized protein AB675_12151 [Cyphellophora attinorum]|uniref:N-acetyltransferase domain-containing protein n=1 Tax=Cyphellophora attinorum TaxID=1664694 RepID=A0A0N1P009_9EURO|nr:uncharacterized protein AB675_12151 [Phialophora attinorum]KPI38454.1 hypothetical protein AB675_12151 [Phialophora attinorum]
MNEAPPDYDLRAGLPLVGTFVTLSEVTEADIPALYTAYGLPASTAVFKYLPGGPPSSFEDFHRFIASKIGLKTLCFLAVRADPKHLSYGSYPEPDATTASHAHNVPLGILPLYMTDQINGCLEVGAILGPQLQRTPASTEANYLNLKHAFETLGAHRVAWKFLARNEKSRGAAKRMGFVKEGLVREDRRWEGERVGLELWGMVKGEWEGAVKRGFETWLDRGNFWEDGKQKRSLEECR